MTSRKAFWLTLATVGIPSVLIWGFLLYKVGPQVDEFPLYLLFILLPALFLAPLVHRRYMNGPVQKTLTRDAYLRQAIVTGCLAVIYTVLGLMDSHTGWRHLMRFASAVVCALGALDSLRRASRAEKTKYGIS
jgi:uncharacterized membrane protein YhaH (DUF805 family)